MWKGLVICPRLMLRRGCCLPAPWPVCLLSPACFHLPHSRAFGGSVSPSIPSLSLDSGPSAVHPGGPTAACLPACTLCSEVQTSCRCSLDTPAFPPLLVLGRPPRPSFLATAYRKCYWIPAFSSRPLSPSISPSLSYKFPPASGELLVACLSPPPGLRPVRVAVTLERPAPAWCCRAHSSPSSPCSSFPPTTASQILSLSPVGWQGGRSCALHSVAGRLGPGREHGRPHVELPRMPDSQARAAHTQPAHGREGGLQRRVSPPPSALA